MRREGNGWTAFVLVTIAVAGFGLLLWLNSRPTAPVRVIIPTQVETTTSDNAWQSLLSEGFGSNSTPLPTVAIPTGEFLAPTLASSGEEGATVVAPQDMVAALPTATFAPIAATPTPPPPTPTIAATDLPVTAESVTRPPAVWQPPPLVPPISRDPYGRDHYWFLRPVDSNATNYGLSYYTYGSDGQDTSPLRVHTGIDMANPIGEPVRAAGSGTVVWAAEGLRIEEGAAENSPSYGKVIVIEHDFGYRGQRLYTLYAHLSAILINPGQIVNGGDVIGLVGNSGRVTGPHVHFEVRLGENRYGATVNPILWMVPYVGHGVIAGRVTDVEGNMINDVDITIRNWGNGLVQATSTTYIFQDTPLDVNSDPIWQENFAVADIPAGRYEVIASIDGARVSKIIDVLEGTTSFVDLSPQGPSTSLPIVAVPGE